MGWVRIEKLVPIASSLSWLHCHHNGVCSLARDYPIRLPSRYPTKPREALRGGIPWSFLEPLGRSWSHFVGIYRQRLTSSLKN